MYIHQHTCVSPYLDRLVDSAPVSQNGQLVAAEPRMDGVPPAMLRRMSKAVRMGLAAGLPVLKQHKADGIIIGTANGGMEDCIRFLNQIVDYDEGLLTPSNFVQSTPNAIAGQLGMLNNNHGYNATHVHHGLAFENALLDAMLWIKDRQSTGYLLGGVDEISTYNFNIDRLAGWYNVQRQHTELYTVSSNGTVAGEGAAFFFVNNQPVDRLAQVVDMRMLQTRDERIVGNALHAFLKKHKIDGKSTLFINGYNGDARMLRFSNVCESGLVEADLVYFKQVTGEYPTAAAFALWLACEALQSALPSCLYRKPRQYASYTHIVLYNLYHELQHSFILLKP